MPVTVNNRIIAWLINLGWLEENESEDRRQIGAALVSLLANAEASEIVKYSGTRGQPNGFDHGSIDSTPTHDEGES